MTQNLQTNNFPESNNEIIKFQACSKEEREKCTIYNYVVNKIHDYINGTNILDKGVGLHPSNINLVCTVPQRIPHSCPKIANLTADLDMEQYNLYYSHDIGIDYERDNIPYPNLELIEDGLRQLDFYSDNDIIEQLDKIRPLTWIFKLGVRCHFQDSCPGIVNPDTHICDICKNKYEDIMEDRDKFIKLLKQQFDERKN